MFDLISFSGNGSPNIEASLEALEYHTELFNQYLDRHKKEIGEVLEIKGLQDNFIVDDTMYEVLQGTPKNEASLTDDDDDSHIDDFDFDDDEDDEDDDDSHIDDFDFDDDDTIEDFIHGVIDYEIILQPLDL